MAGALLPLLQGLVSGAGALFGAGGAGAAAGGGAPAVTGLGPSATQTALSPLPRTAAQQSFSPFGDITGSSLAAGPLPKVGSQGGGGSDILGDFKKKLEAEAKKGKGGGSGPPIGPVPLSGRRAGPQRQIQPGRPSNIQPVTFGAEQSPVSLSPFQGSTDVLELLAKLNQGLSSPFGA